MVDYSEKLCEAIGIVANGLLEDLKYDKTVLCTIIDDSKSSKGEYIVSNGSANFTAYGSSDYKKNQNVYITIPQGDYNQQKIIVGQKLSEEEDTFILQKPLDTFVNVTGNVLTDENVIIYNEKHYDNIPLIKEFYSAGKFYYIDENGKYVLDNSVNFTENRKYYLLYDPKNHFKLIANNSVDKDVGNCYNPYLLSKLNDYYNAISNREKEIENKQKEIKELIDVVAIGNLRKRIESLQSEIQTIKNNNKIIEDYLSLIKCNGAQKILYKYIVPEDKILKNYTKLGIRANFRSWLKARNVIDGDYGLTLSLKYIREDSTETTVNEESGEQKTVVNTKTGFYQFQLNSSEMFGSPYNFQNYRSQEKTFDILETDRIVEIYIYFYQMPESFRDTNNHLIMPNDAYDLFVNENSVELLFGYDIDDFKEEKITLYSTDSATYKHSLENAKKEDNPNNFKSVKLKWIHMLDADTAKSAGMPAIVVDNTNIDVASKAQRDNIIKIEADRKNALDKHEAWLKIYKNTASEEDKEAYKKLYGEYKADAYPAPTTTNEETVKKNINDEYDQKVLKAEGVFKYHIRWYRYNYGAPSADSYSGVYWERIYPDFTEKSDTIIDNNHKEFIKNKKTEYDNWYKTQKISEIAQKQYKYYKTDNTIETEVVNSIQTNINNFFSELENSGLWIYYKKLNLEYDYATWETQIWNATHQYNMILKPDSANNDSEKIKAILFFNNKTYRSNEEIFTNDTDVPNQATVEKTLGLYIVCDDGTYGNYRIYDQGNNLIDSGQANISRSLSCRFDATGTKTENDASWLTEASQIIWTFPVRNTMLKLEGFNYDSFSWTNEDTADTKYGVIQEKDADNNTITNYATITRTPPTEGEMVLTQNYFIDSYYSVAKNINTVSCEVLRYGRTYITPKEMTFGQAGTTGTDVTLVLDFEDNKNALNPYKIDETGTHIGDTCYVRAFLYDADNQLINFETVEEELTFTWDWYNIRLVENDKALIAINGKNNYLPISEEEQVITGDKKLYRVPLSVEYGENGQQAKDLLNGKYLHILQLTLDGWGDYKLKAYLPIPVKRENMVKSTNDKNEKIYIYENQFHYLEGPTTVIYLSDGNINYYRTPYKMHSIKEIENADQATWSMLPIATEHNQAYTYKVASNITADNYNDGIYYIIAGSNYELIEKDATTPAFNKDISYYYKQAITEIVENHTPFFPYLSEKAELIPLNIYVEDTELCAVQYKDKNSIPYWTQPILIIKNKYPSAMINRWDGSLVVDEENNAILAASMAAGKKNDDNTFSGVLMGDWGQKGDDSISKQTGVYGFNHGEMSYAFKEDGTAFIGKDGRGRIEFDGNYGLIRSSAWKNFKIGMELDVDDGSIQMANGESTYIIVDSPNTIDYPNYYITSKYQLISSTNQSSRYKYCYVPNDYIEIPANIIWNPKMINLYYYKDSENKYHLIRNQSDYKNNESHYYPKTYEYKRITEWEANTFYEEVEDNKRIYINVAEIGFPQIEGWSYYSLNTQPNRFITLASSQKQYPLSIGISENVSSRHFLVDWNGKAKLTDGEFSGIIEAEEGYIGGWEIGPSTLSGAEGGIILDSDDCSITGGILRSNAGGMLLDGFLTTYDANVAGSEGKTRIGFMQSDVGTDNDAKTYGAGIQVLKDKNDTSSTISQIKATSYNAGMSYTVAKIKVESSDGSEDFLDAGGGYISISNWGTNIGGYKTKITGTTGVYLISSKANKSYGETAVGFAEDNGNNNLKHKFWMSWQQDKEKDGQTRWGWSLNTDIPAERQHGIYARFA